MCIQTTPKGGVMSKYRTSSQVVTAKDSITYGSPPAYVQTFSTKVYTDSQEVHSESHDVKNLGKVRGDIGGAFLSQRVQAVFSGETLRLSEAPGSFYKRSWEGVAFPGGGFLGTIRSPYTSGGLASSCPTPSSQNAMNSWGTQAVSQCIPTSPAVEGATAIAELMTGIPKVPGRSGGNAGGEYLNVQFGILPTVSDLKKFRNAAKNADRIVGQLHRDSGKIVRRRLAYPVDEETGSTFVYTNRYLVGAGDSAPDLNLQQGGTLTVTTHTSSRRWYAGAFTYHIPKRGMGRRLSELDRKYGIQPGLDTAWNLVPFSWLVDWQSNMGSVMSNMSQFSQDGLVQVYGYLMHEQVRHVTHSLVNRVLVNGTWQPQTTVGTLVYTTKQRTGANPFGFGVDPVSLSGRQLAILAALGLSRR